MIISKLVATASCYGPVCLVAERVKGVNISFQILSKMLVTKYFLILVLYFNKMVLLLTNHNGVFFMLIICNLNPLVIL